MSVKTAKQLRVARHSRLRKRVDGSVQRPRLAIFRSSAHIYAQIIDDTVGTTLVSASSTIKGFGKGNTVEAATKVGKDIAAKAKAKGIDTVVFDRGGFKYHGRVAALADAAREGGLDF